MGYENCGRRPQPTALKALRGNPSKTRLNEHEAVPPAGPVTKPATLSLDGGRVWEELAPVCLHMGTLTAADVKPFATLCELEATRERASLAKDGPKREAAVRLELATASALRPYYALFGLDPVSRTRIVVAPSAGAPVSKWA